MPGTDLLMAPDPVVDTDVNTDLTDAATILSAQSRRTSSGAQILLNEMDQHMSLWQGEARKHKQALKDHKQALLDSHATMNEYARKLVQDYGWTWTQISEATGIPHRTPGLYPETLRHTQH